MRIHPQAWAVSTVAMSCAAALFMLVGGAIWGIMVRSSSNPLIGGACIVCGIVLAIWAYLQIPVTASTERTAEVRDVQVAAGSSPFRLFRALRTSGEPCPVIHVDFTTRRRR